MFKGDESKVLSGWFIGPKAKEWKLMLLAKCVG
jgi:hypothetical protein